MEYRTLSPAGLEVSTICLGTMMFGAALRLAESRRLIYKTAGSAPLK